MLILTWGGIVFVDILHREIPGTDCTTRGSFSVICGRILSMGGHFPTQSNWYFALENDLPLIVFPHKSVFCVGK
jgi:hypothetical protein